MLQNTTQRQSLNMQSNILLRTTQMHCFNNNKLPRCHRCRVAVAAAAAHPAVQVPPLLLAANLAATAAAAAAPSSPAAAAAAVQSSEHAAMIPWAPALALLGLSWFAPQVFAAAADFLKPRKCRACYGSGDILCAACGARGKRGGAFEGGPLVACGACEGRGRLRCTACNATGLANSWLWSPTNDPGAWGARGE